MGRSYASSWWVAPKSMVSLLGAEHRLFKQSGSAVLKKFYLSAILIVVILLLSGCSIFYAIDLLVHNYYVEVFLSVFVSLLFGLMYVFLMNTFAKDHVIPKNIFTSLSNITRIGFILFMAFILSKPVELRLMEDYMESKVAAYRITLIDRHTYRVNTLYQDDLSRLQHHRTKQQAQLALYSTPAVLQDINVTEIKINDIHAQRARAIAVASQRIQESSFFLYRVRQSARTFIGWICCIVIMALFCVPGYLIYSISGNDAYYKLKKEYETSIVKREYAFFEKQYSKIFKERFGLDRHFYSAFEDPPFNTRRKQEPEYRSNDDFLKKYLKG